MDRSAGKHLLVVEDEALLAIDTATILEGAGYAVVGPAPDVDAALDLLSSARIDGALLDVHLRTGMVWPVAEALDARRVPFMFISGYGMERDFPERFQGTPRLDKPVRQDLLLDAVAHLWAK